MGCLHFPMLILVMLFLSHHLVIANSLPKMSLQSVLDLKSSAKLDSMSEVLSNIKRNAAVSRIKNAYDLTRIDPHTQEEKDAILAKHNEFRSRVDPRATNMEFMTWNEDLAYLAGLWSSVCYWGHGMPQHPRRRPFAGSDGSIDIGQNMWRGEGKPDGPSKVVSWHDNEKRHYDYNSNSCAAGQQCGHYTQVVWGLSKEVGCSRAFCEHTIDNKGNRLAMKNVWIETCHYAPGGNLKDTKPYKRGPSCTKCKSGVNQCYDNMCRLCTDHDEPCDCRQVCHNCGTVTPGRDGCKCDCTVGWYGKDCKKRCIDKHANCWKSPGWPGPDSCKLNPSIPKNCPYMCGLCEKGNVQCDE